MEAFHWFIFNWNAVSFIAIFRRFKNSGNCVCNVISIMLLFAYNGYLVWKNPGNLYVFIGAIVFVISDSILAINKFYTPIEKSSFFIMLTYLVAQYLIVIGVLKLNPKKQNNISQIKH